MAQPEQHTRERVHPMWVKPIEPARVLGSLGSDARFRRRILTEQRAQKDSARASFSDKHPGYTELINELLFQPDVREVKFREAVSDFLADRSERGRLNILVVNNGDVFHDLSLPAELGEFSNKIDFLGNPPLYPEEIRDECTNMFDGSCVFSEIAEGDLSLSRKDDSRGNGYDLILIYRDGIRDKEGIQRQSTAMSKLFASRLLKAINPGGSIITSADESIRQLRTNLHVAAYGESNFSSRVIKDTVFADIDLDTVHVPTPIHKNNTVLEISRDNDADEEVTAIEIQELRRHGWSSWSRRKKRFTVVGGLAGVGAAAAIAAVLTQSPSEPSCESGTTAVVPKAIYEYAGHSNHVKTVFQLPGNPQVTVDINRDQETVSVGNASATFQEKPAVQIGKPYINRTLFIKPRTDAIALGCEAA